jgi:hypothetical protein
MSRALTTTAAFALLMSGLLSGLLSGCGDESPSNEGRDEKSDARAAAGDRWARKTTPGRMLRIGAQQKADSVRVRLDVDPDGSTPRTRFDLTVIDGRNCFGTVRFGTSPNLDVTVVRGKDFLRTSASGWRAFMQASDPSVADAQATAIGKLYEGKWVSTGQVAGFCSLLDDVPLKGAKAAKKAGFTEVGGVRGVKVDLVVDGDRGSAVLEAQAPHHLLAFRSDGGSARFGDYDEATKPPVPPKSQQLDLTDLPR